MGFRDNIRDKIRNTIREQNRKRTREGGGGGGMPQTMRFDDGKAIMRHNSLSGNELQLLLCSGLVPALI
ncbi:hypothetical protein CH330_05510 [candidate division WOR-3 bacterium JGI_Cruoil_03_51_56]|uniref:Uncharacterized protein n=1 Tax=candidate division WOR-3 bacterium JGI_Cruoil_03_51_56 TaxID=1973747 RepID=A0A235BU14_UNCW3|nr:MAG: hypothetical protein CH330_05510 [candidate division WOR-3 bacterium JGI_Cruoil_03_51_56]